MWTGSRKDTDFQGQSEGESKGAEEQGGDVFGNDGNTNTGKKEDLNCVFCDVSGIFDPVTTKRRRVRRTCFDLME